MGAQVAPLHLLWKGRSTYYGEQKQIRAQEVHSVITKITGKMVYDALVEELGHPGAFISSWHAGPQEDYKSVTVDGDVDCEAIADFINKQEPTKDSKCDASDPSWDY